MSSPVLTSVGPVREAQPGSPDVQPLTFFDCGRWMVNPSSSPLPAGVGAGAGAGAGAAFVVAGEVAVAAAEPPSEPVLGVKLVVLPQPQPLQACCLGLPLVQLWRRLQPLASNGVTARREPTSSHTSC